MVVVVVVIAACAMRRALAAASLPVTQRIERRCDKRAKHFVNEG